MKKIELHQARYGRNNWFNWETPQPQSERWFAQDELQGEACGACSGSSDGAAHGYAEQLAGELGLDPALLCQLSGDDVIGFSLKKLAKGIGKGIKAGIKVAAPVLKVAGTVTAFVVPAVGVPMLAAAAGADKLITAAQKGSKAAKQAYKATKHLASSGHPDAQRALAVLDRVQKERKKKGVAPGAALPSLQAAQPLLQQKRKQLQAPVPAQGSADQGTHAGFLVTPGARVRQVLRFKDGSLKDRAA